MKRIQKLLFLPIFAVFMLLGSLVFAQDDGVTIAVLTPYLAQPGTQFMVEGFQAAAEERGWTVNVIDTAGELADLNSRVQDVVTQQVDAIVLNADPSQVPALADATAAGIPVFGMDAGVSPDIVVNVTSNAYEMAAVTATYVVDRLNGAGRVVIFGFNAYPPVQKRGVVAEAIFGNSPDIEVIDFIEPDVTDGGIADSRARMEAILAANPDPGSISAVWAAWDQPALGALQAIEAAGREGEGIIITGIDANPQAVDAITAGGNFEASIAQDFSGIGSLVAEQIASYLDGNEPTQTVVYAPTTLVTASNAGEFVSEPAQ
jgi:ribose transport system substrate-binding protein